MRISLNWLRELVAFDLDAETLAETLTLAGFEVEEIEDRRTWADGVVVGKVIEREQHPNADRLSVCRVEVGAAEPLTIVCGAANVAAGQTVAVATLGTYLPKIDLKMKPTKLRGVRSEGMICSLAELGLEREAEGIHVFAQGDALAAGTDVRSLLGLDDVVLDLSSTANRADALSMVGIAREVAALTGWGVTLPIARSPLDALTAAQGQGQGQSQEAAVAVRVADAKVCPAYGATVIEGVTIAPSPQWLQRRLLAAGVRPINNVVDVTNYVMLEWGQPLHGFDRDRLLAIAEVGAGEVLEMGVRPGRPEETLKTLDGQTRTLSAQNVVIVAGDRPVALAGVMGGEASEVHGGTTNLLLEAALFEPAAVRRSARSAGIRTEASTRYERGVNQVEFETAWQRAVALILEVAGGQVTEAAIADGRPDLSTFSTTIPLRLNRIHQILGPILGEDPKTREPIQGFIAGADVERILMALGCTLTLTQPGDAEEVGREWAVTVPPYRYRDLEREIDLIEEIARLFGYNHFCATLPPKTEFGFLPADLLVLRQLRDALRGAGLTELMHYSLRKPEGDRQIPLSNPLLAEYSALRTDLLSGLIEAFQFNREQGNGPLNGFEIGRVFWSDEEGFQEADHLAGILGGDPSVGRWRRGGKEEPLTWYEAKGILESVFQTLGVAVEFQSDRSNPNLHPGRTASLWIRGERLGIFGQLHPELCRERDLPDEVYGFELDLEAIFKATIDDAPEHPLYVPFSTLPSSNRDLAFFAPVKISVADLEKTIVKAGKPLLASVELFDEYRGDHVPEGQRSLAFRLTYRSPERTLTDEDVEPVHQRVRDDLSEKFGVSLRS